MTDVGSEKFRDEAILVARILLALLFLTFGWSKLTGYAGTVAYMTKTGLPLPSIAAIAAVVIELGGSIANIFGIFTRPVALIVALYTVVSARSLAIPIGP